MQTPGDPIDSTEAKPLADGDGRLGPANRVRATRAALKRRLREEPTRASSRAMAADLLLEPPAEIRTMPVFDLLTACRQTGKEQARRLLQRAAIHDSLREVGRLTPRQRDALASLLRERESQLGKGSQAGTSGYD